MLKIIHISDFHLEKEELSIEKEKLIKALIVDFEMFVNIDENTIVVISGDLIDKGGLNFKVAKNPFYAFKEVFIDKIVEKYPILQRRIFITPGNHDITRKSEFKYTRNGFLQEASGDYSRITQIINQNRLENSFNPQLHSYKEFEKQFYADYPNCRWTNFDVSIISQLNNLEIGISDLNSAWLCYDDTDFGKLVLGYSQVEESYDIIKDADVKIAIFHHPFEFFIEEDKKRVRSFLSKHYDIILNGHTHNQFSSYGHSIYGMSLHSVSNSSIGQKTQNSDFHSGYSIINFYPKDKVEINFRKYRWDHHDFVVDTDIGVEPGKLYINIPSSEHISIKAKVSLISDGLINTKIEKFDEDLIIYNVDESVPGRIGEIFVEPTLCNYMDNAVPDDNNTVKYYSVDEIISANDNYLIYGKKESGKTILLDYIFIKLAKNIEKNNKIPVLIKFNEIGNREIIQIVRTFLSINKETFFEIAKHYEIVLLIDSIEFPVDSSSKSQIFHNINKLKRFVESLENIKIIATANQLFENLIPDEYLEFNLSFDFTPVFIHSMNTGQIRSLIKKWFKNKEIDYQEKIENLLKNFRNFGLPKTPLSVTMFLWIINKQEKEPINNAVLVEIFIENLLEKANFDNVFSQSFDFHNKKRLLSRLALFMLKNGDENSYSVSYDEAYRFIKKYLEHKFGNAKNILDSLINRKILFFSIGEERVRFKNNFFFHYFLSINISSNHNFREEVLDNILEFTNEIEYYTGINRDDDYVFDIVIKHLNTAYTQLNQIISNSNSIDNFLETNNQLSEFIDMSKIENKPDEKEIDKVFDTALKSTPVRNKIEPKKYDRKNQIQLDKILKLACNVLKNSEEIDDFDKRYMAYKDILESSISFFLIYRQYMLLKFKNGEETNLPKDIDFSVFIILLPIMHQLVLFDWLGTIKLQPVLNRKIESDRVASNISTFEKFLSIFLYVDIKAQSSRKMIKGFISQINDKYILDAIFIKVLTYFHLRSNSPETDKFYLDLLYKIKNKLGLINERSKSKFFLNMKREKKTKNSTIWNKR